MLGDIQNSTPGRAIRCSYLVKSTVYHEIQQYQTPSPWEYIFVAAPPLYIYIYIATPHGYFQFQTLPKRGPEKNHHQQKRLPV